MPRYLSDKEVSIFKKLLLILMLFYVFSPIDLLPDPILGFGFIDDAVLAIYVISRASHELDKYIDVDTEYEHERDDDIDMAKSIDNVEYEVKDEESKDKKD